MIFDAESLDDKTTAKLTLLKIALAILLACLMLSVSFILYPARYHFKNKFLNPPLGNYSCSVYDKSGRKLAEGRFSIQRHAGTDIAGDWQFTPTGSVERDGDEWRHVDDRIRNFVGQLIKDDFEINMNPNVFDANDYLRGKFVGRTIRGDFLFCGFAGCTVQGSFEAVRE